MAVESKRKLVMKFKTVAGDDFNINLNYAKANLKTGDGAALVADAMDEVMNQQPFNVTLAIKNGAQIVETTTTDVEFA